MKINSKIYFYIAIMAIIVAGCEPKTDDFDISAGNADFTKYIAIGNSLTAGFADGELYQTSQNNSYPSIIAKQIQSINTSLQFQQPLMKDDIGFGNRLILGYSTDCKGITSLAPVKLGETPDMLANTTNIAAQGPYQNLGVPGAKSFHIGYAGYGHPTMGNPYYARFASTPSSSIIEEAVAQAPTFFTLWIGNNDVLGYATAGGENNPKNDSITPITILKASIDGILQALTQNGAKGAIANIPDVTSSPFFTTVKSNALLLDEANATALNQAYSAYNAGAQAMGLESIEFTPGYNGFIIQDLSAEYTPLGNIRQIKQNELILLTIPQDSIKCGGWGSQKPIPHYYVLDEHELNAISNAVNQFNEAIKELSQTYNLAYIDMNSHLDNIKSYGLTIDGKLFTCDLVTGNLFSLDGIHLTPQGYAITANYFIEAINTKYNAKIPKANILDYPSGIVFP